MTVFSENSREIEIFGHFAPLLSPLFLLKVAPKWCKKRGHDGE